MTSTHLARLTCLLGCALIAMFATGPAPAVAADGGVRDAAAPRDSGPPGVQLAGKVVDSAGKPVPGVVVFAVDRSSPQIRAMARSGAGGIFRMGLEPVVHDFGIMSAAFLLAGYQRVGPSNVLLTIAPAFPETSPLKALERSKQSFLGHVFPYARDPAARAPVPAPAGGALSIGMVTGTITDELGAALGGVRLLAIDERKNALIAVTQTDPRGRYTLVTLAGPNRFVVYAPGLLMRGVRRSGKPGVFDFIMKVDPNPEELTLRTGRKLSFRLEDSIFPEAVPPAKAKAVISADYGIDLTNCFCPGDLLHAPAPTPEQWKDACKWSAGEPCSIPSKCPMTVWARQCQLPRFWWLRMLQEHPPNPTRRESGPDVKTMWWYDSIKAMQEADAKAARAAPAR